jgi:hypothetical protein
MRTPMHWRTERDRHFQALGRKSLAGAQVTNSAWSGRGCFRRCGSRIFVGFEGKGARVARLSGYPVSPALAVSR